jgi:hypothetical protein
MRGPTRNPLAYYSVQQPIDPFIGKGASVSVSNLSPPFPHPQSALDRRAINVVSHLLLAGIWLEHQFGSVPKMLTALAAESGKTGLAAFTRQSVGSQAI